MTLFGRVEPFAVRVGGRLISDGRLPRRCVRATVADFVKMLGDHARLTGLSLIHSRSVIPSFMIAQQECAVDPVVELATNDVAMRPPAFVIHVVFFALARSWAAVLGSVDVQVELPR